MRPIRPDLYILDESGKPTPCEDLHVWGEWFRHRHHRQLRHTRMRAKGHEFLVSTIFLGLDHNWALEGPPLLWETMVLGAPDDGERQQRFSERSEALTYHDLMVVMMTTLFGAETLIGEVPRAWVVER